MSYQVNLTEESKKGFWSFVLKVGMLRWGLPFSIIMYIINIGLKFDFRGIITWLIAGVLIGGFMFGSAMYLYAKAKLSKN
jgi:hypothetical protein